MDSELSAEPAKPLTKRRPRSKAWPTQNKFLLEYLIQAKQEGKCSLIEYDRSVLESAAEELRKKGYIEINSSSIKSKISAWKYEWRIYVTAVETYDFDVNEDTGMLYACDEEWNDLNRRFYDAEYRFRHNPLKNLEELREVFASMFLGTKEEADKISKSWGKPDYERNLYAANLMLLDDGQTIGSLSYERMKSIQAEMADGGATNALGVVATKQPKIREVVTRRAPSPEIRECRQGDQFKRKARAEIPYNNSHKRQKPNSTSEVVSSNPRADWIVDLESPNDKIVPFMQPRNTVYQAQPQMMDRLPWDFSPPYSYHAQIMMPNRGISDSRYNSPASAVLTTSASPHMQYQATFSVPGTATQAPHKVPLRSVDPNVIRAQYHVPSKSSYQFLNNGYTQPFLGSQPSKPGV